MVTPPLVPHTRGDVSQAAEPSRPKLGREYFKHRRGRMAELHRQLRKTIPQLNGTLPLSGDQLDADFREALRQTSPDQFKYWYLEANLMKRYLGADLSDANTRVDNAVKKLLESEVKCAESNRVFHLGLDWSNALVPLEMRKKLLRARQIIRRILGEVFPWDEFPSACDFTPGATTEFRKVDSDLPNKWLMSSHVTERALPYAAAFVAWTKLPGYFPQFIVERANSVFTVPKNFERDRTACKPVTWNGFLQKGIGKMIKRRLQRKEYLLLPDAQDEHRVLAKLGSAVEGTLATRDLSSASDTVSTGLLEALLPDSWFQRIADLREEYGVLPDGTTLRWEKVSTMGNGFTFELETLVFYALVRAACNRGSLVSVYGDDIIFPSIHSDSVDELLTFCGFEINRDKSFSSLHFRESCGGHYFQGVDVKPFYLQQLPKTLSDVINLHNEIVRWHLGKPRRHDRWYNVFAACRAYVPRVLWGPAPLDGVLWADWDEATPRYNRLTQSFVIAGVMRVPEPNEDLSWHKGAYYQKLWKESVPPWESAETSYRSEVSDREALTWRYVDRAQWTRLTAETLCT